MHVVALDLCGQPWDLAVKVLPKPLKSLKVKTREHTQRIKQTEERRQKPRMPISMTQQETPCHALQGEDRLRYTTTVQGSAQKGKEGRGYRWTKGEWIGGDMCIKGSAYDAMSS